MLKNVKEQGIVCRDKGRVKNNLHKSCSAGCREKLVCILAGILAALLISWLFYRSWCGMILFLPLYFGIRKEYEKRQRMKKKAQLLQEFKDGIQAVSTSLLAGYSMENAWREAEKEIKELYGKDSILYPELCQMNVAVRMNKSLESVLLEFAKRSGCEEIESFAEVFSFAKRSGGDFAGMIQTTVWKLTGKIDVEREIATVLAGKKLEGRIMNLMPIFILAYLNVSSGDFLQVLYGNILGVMVMSVALGVYVTAIRWSEHILDIQI